MDHHIGMTRRLMADEPDRVLEMLFADSTPKRLRYIARYLNNIAADAERGSKAVKIHWVQPRPTSHDKGSHRRTCDGAVVPGYEMAAAKAQFSADPNQTTCGNCMRSREWRFATGEIEKIPYKTHFGVKRQAPSWYGDPQASTYVNACTANAYSTGVSWGDLDKPIRSYRTKTIMVTLDHTKVDCKTCMKTAEFKRASGKRKRKRKQKKL